MREAYTQISQMGSAGPAQALGDQPIVRYTCSRVAVSEECRSVHGKLLDKDHGAPSVTPKRNLDVEGEAFALEHLFSIGHSQAWRKGGLPDYRDANTVPRFGKRTRQ